MHYPKDVEIWEHSPGRKLAEVVIRIANQRGALAKCSQVIADLNVNILTGFVTRPRSSRTATLSFFVDITDSNGLADFKRALQNIDVVQSVDAIAAEDGFMVDKQHFPVQWAGRRAVLLRADALNEMLNRLWTVFGTGAATIIDQMAEAMGRHSAKEIVEDFGPDFAAEQLDELLGTYSALGYAEVSIERTKSSDFPMVVNARDLFECGANAKLGLHRKSAFFRAHLRGFLSAVFDKAFDVQEVQCSADGDEVCSFRASLVETVAPKVTSRVPEKPGKGIVQSNF